MELKLIEFIKKNPGLYDKTNKYYKNIYFRNKKYGELSKELNIPVERLKKRWRSLKDKYNKDMKNLKQPSGGGINTTATKRWKWMDAMSFLNDEAEASSSEYTTNNEMECVMEKPEALPIILDSELNISSQTFSSISTTSIQQQRGLEKMEDFVKEVTTSMAELANTAKIYFAPKTNMQLFLDSIAKILDEANLSLEATLELQIDMLKVVQNKIKKK